MTHEELLLEKCDFSGVYNTFSPESHHKDHPLYINLKPYLQDFPKTDKPIHAFNGRKRHGLDHVLKKLSTMEIPGREHVEEYLRDQYRRNCRPNTLRNSFIAIESFLAFIKQRRKRYLEEIVRKDLDAYIEHDVDFYGMV